MKLPAISFIHLIKETVQKLHEVKPFVDPKLKSKPNDRIQYVATNDHRYPSELAFIDTKTGHVVFFNIQRKEVERISVDRLSSTHWVRDYMPGLKYNQGADKTNQPKEKDLSMINKGRAKAALRQIKSGKRDDGMGEFTARLFGVSPSGDAIEITDESGLNKYTKFGLAEGKLNEATDAFYIKQLVGTFKRFKLDTRKYEIMMDSAYGAGSKIPVLRPKGGFGDGVMIDQSPAGKIELLSSKSGRPIPGKNKFTDIDQAMVVATKYVDTIKESINEGKYDHMIGKSFKLPGRGNASMKITRIEDDRFVHASPYDEWVKYDDKASSSMYDIKKVIQHNPEIDTKQVKKRTAWNKGTGNPHLITKREYAKILMGAMKDMKSMGDEDATHDVAQSMIYDQSILARLVKDHPGKNSTQLAQQLQWDLEAAA